MPPRLYVLVAAHPLVKIEICKPAGVLLMRLHVRFFNAALSFHSRAQIQLQLKGTQATWEQIDIKTITGKQPGHNEPSIHFWETPNIENMAAFRNLEVIPHGIQISRMPDLKSLAGLEKVTSIGTKNTGISITIVDHPNWKMDQFADASALEGAALDGRVSVTIGGNGNARSVLGCIPSSWYA